MQEKARDASQQGKTFSWRLFLEFRQILHLELDETLVN